MSNYTPTTEEVQFFTFGTWFHRKRGHRQHWRVVSVPMFDMSARGRLVDCSCGKVWAL